MPEKAGATLYKMLFSCNIFLNVYCMVHSLAVQLESDKIKEIYCDRLTAPPCMTFAPSES